MKSILMLALLLVGTGAWAQLNQPAMNSQGQMVVNLKLDKIKDDPQNNRRWLDLIFEVKRTVPQILKQGPLNIARVNVLAKAGIGGGALGLVINGEYVDAKSIDNDPEEMQVDLIQFDLFSLENKKGTPDELIDIRSAQLVVYGEVVLGSISLEIGGARFVAVNAAPILPTPQFAQTQVSQQVSAETPRITQIPGQPKPPVVQPTVVDGQQVLPTAPSQQRPTVVFNPPPQAPPQAAAQTAPSAPVSQRKCLEDFCVGDKVKNSWGFKGRVVDIDFNEKELVIKWSYADELERRRPSKVRR